jgi:hypothetical protein
MRFYAKVSILFCLLALTACSSLPKHPPVGSLKAYVAGQDSWYFSPHAPVFVVEEPDQPYNRIGTPSARLVDDDVEVFVDPSRPTIYTRKTTFNTEHGTYTNLTYRVHFEKVPFFHLGWGDNVGLILIVTLNEAGQPVLFTTMHTCGCYLTFVPTSYLPDEAYPEGWNRERQKVYGENLPGMLDFGGAAPDRSRLMLLLSGRTHRVVDMWLNDVPSLSKYDLVRIPMKPLKILEGLSLPDGASTSFYETEGGRQDYVKNSQKPWERLFMSWWTLNWRVGEDKKLGRDCRDGSVFYTSLKPWARTASDLRNFPVFLQYWGWNL